MLNIRAFAILSALVVALSTPYARAETAGQYIDDSAITTKVKAALLADNQLKALHISVQTTQGIVQLSGTVDSSAQEEEAVKVANRVDGVKSVSDAISLRNAQ